MPRLKKPHNNPSHRPPKTINWDLVDEMLMAGSPGTEIAPKFSMHPETFYDRVSKEKGVGFTEYSQRVRSSGDGNLRLSYYKSALDGNTQLLISLGKERLGYGKSEIADPTGTRDAIVSFAEKKAELEEMGLTIVAIGDGRSTQEDQQSLLHKELRGEEAEV